MGKKKRYIMRAAKFGKKMFNFLDKLDGTQDSNLTDSRIDTSISKISITDRGNRTYAIQVEGRGPGDSNAKANLEQDTVKLTIDGTAVHAANFLVFAEPPAGSAGDRDRFKTTMVAPGPADGAESAAVKLSAAEHTIIAQIMKENKIDVLSKEKTKKFVLAEPVKDLTAVSAEEDTTPGDIEVNAAAAIDLAAANNAGAAGEAAGRLPGEEDFDMGNQAAGKNSLLISLVDKDKTPVPITAVNGCLTVGDNVQSTAGATADFHFRSAGVALNNAASPYVMTVTPVAKDGTAHTPSAITISVPIA